MIPVEVIKAPIHHLGIDAKITPCLDKHLQEGLSCLPLDHRENFLFKVACHEGAEALENLRVVVLVVTVVDDKLVDFGKLGVTADYFGVAPQVAQQLAHVVVVDDPGHLFE